MGSLTRTRWVTAALGLALFQAGAVVGGAAVQQVHVRRARELFRSDPVVLRRHVVARGLETRLDLDDAQRARLLEILDAQADDYREALELSRPRVQELRRALAEELEPVLDESQRAELHRVVSEAESVR
jgi:hypothetical protein